MANNAASKVPEKIGKYRVVNVIAAGGMGVVYKAIHPNLNRYITIKKMLGHDSTEKQRFEREAKILLDMQSPFIVHLYDYFVENGSRYIVEELVDGMSCDKLLKKQTNLSVEAALVIVLDVCKALKYAHSRGIVHRDIKGGNILISKRCEIKLTDFGIASGKGYETSETGGGGNLTMAGVSLGSPSYMAPEQINIGEGVDNRADIYALGIMLYEFVTGKKPYDVSKVSSFEVLSKLQNLKHDSPTKLNPAVPRSVSRVILKMMAPNKEKRYKSVVPIMHFIEKYLKYYNNMQIRQTIATMVANPSKKIDEPEYSKKGEKLAKALRLAAACAVFFAIFTVCYQKGYIHRYLLRRFFTPVSVRVEMPSTGNSSLDLPVYAYFFKNDGKTTPQVAVVNAKSKSTHPILGQKHDKKSSGTLISPFVYLRPGDYRVKLVAGSYIWWQSFAVGSGEVTINCSFLRDVKKPIRVIAQVSDYETGKDISSIAKVEVNYGGSWVALRSVPPNKILNNAVWRFRFSAKGYQSEEFSLMFDWYQDELHIGAMLKRVN